MLSLLVTLLIFVVIFGSLSVLIVVKPGFIEKLLKVIEVPWVFWGEGSGGIMILLVFVMFLFFACILCYVLYSLLMSVV